MKRLSIFAGLLLSIQCYGIGGLVGGTLSPGTVSPSPTFTNSTFPSPLVQQLQTNYQLEVLTTNSFNTRWGTNTSTTNNWRFVNMNFTNQDQMYTTNSNGAGYNFAERTNVAMTVPYQGTSRFVTTLQLGAGFASDINIIGFATNSAAADNNNFYGFGFNSSVNFTQYRDNAGNQQIQNSAVNVTGGTGVGFGTSNCVYNIDMFSTASNLDAMLVAPGMTNVIVVRIPWTDTAGVGATNLMILNVANGSTGTATWGNIGGTTQTAFTVNPRTNVEGNSIFFVWDYLQKASSPGMSAGDKIFIMIPPQHDDGTNPSHFIPVCHGNTGQEFDIYGSLLGDYPTNNNSAWGYFSYLCTNGNNIIACAAGDPAGVKDTWNTTNSQAVFDAMVNFVLSRWSVDYIFPHGESAGFTTVVGATALRHFPFAGIDGNHAVGSSSNTYNAGINVVNINTAFGGSTVAQLATGGAIPICGDPYGIPAGMLAGVPMRFESSSQDEIVRPTNQTDLVCIKMGGVPITSTNVGLYGFQELITTNTPLSPEIDDVKVNGGSNGGGSASHGLQCYTTQMAQSFLNWQQRCIAYAKLNPYNYSMSITTNTLTVSSAGVTNNTSHVYLVTLSAGSSLKLQDAFGTQFLTPVNTGTYPLRPGWSLVGSAITGTAVQMLP